MNIKYKTPADYILKKSELYLDIQDEKKAQNPEILKIFDIIVSFLKKTKRVCYGGTAINNILPPKQQFYNPKKDLPDYDFFSPDPASDCRKIVQEYTKNGFLNIEAKPGVHIGTMKVFVNFIGVADITYIPRKFYKKIQELSIEKKGIYFAHPNFLRMSIYFELSHPLGDISRWEKVYKRLELLNKYYPIEINNSIVKTIDKLKKEQDKPNEIDISWNTVVNDYIVRNKLVLFGYKINKMYQNILNNYYININDFFDVNKNIVLNYSIISSNAKNDANQLATDIKLSTGYKTKVIEHKGLGEILAEHYEIDIEIPNSDLIRNIFIYQTINCSSYYELFLKTYNVTINIASIETCLNYYFAFTLAERDYYNTDQILYLCDKLISLSTKISLLRKKGLDPYPFSCIGKQLTKEQMLEKTSLKRKELKSKKDDPEYELYFFKYTYDDAIKDIDAKKSKKKKN